MKAEKTVDVTINYCGQPKAGKVGYYIRGELERINDSEGSHWEEKPNTKEVIFGYCDDFGYMTQMCYGSSYINWIEMLDQVQGHDKMYFDAGSNGRPLWISYTELKRAMDELDIIKLSGQTIGVKDD
jgi:hypothetical protein